MRLVVVLCAALAAAQEIKPKNIDIGLTARWSLTPVDAEAAEFLAEEGGRLFWSFVEDYQPPATSTDRTQLEAVEATASGLLSPLGLKLLRSFLASHVFSPRVQMWRQLAAEVTDAAAEATGWMRACGRVRALGGDAAAAAAALADEVVAEGCTMPTSLEERETSETVPLAVDHVYPGTGSATGAPLVVLCAPLGSASFRAAHAELARRAAAGALTYAYRPLVGSGGGRPQTLQGYGVQLAIKNMEYKVLDDQAAADLGGIDGGEDAASQEGDDEQDVGGFFFSTMAKRRPELDAKIKELREAVTAAEGDASSLKVWAMQDLGVQAASRVLSASSPLETLASLCQNFPFAARGLSKLRVDREMVADVQHLQSTMFGGGFSGLFLNGLPLPIADNDFFGLLQTIQREVGSTGPRDAASQAKPCLCSYTRPSLAHAPKTIDRVCSPLLRADAYRGRAGDTRGTFKDDLAPRVAPAAHGLAASNVEPPSSDVHQRRRKRQKVPAVWAGAARDDTPEHVGPDVLLPS